MSSRRGNNEHLDRVIADYLQRHDRDEQVDRARFLLAHTSLASELRRFFADLDWIERHIQAHELIEDDTADELTCTLAGGEMPRSFIRLDATHGGDGPLRERCSFGDYELLDELGRGGMGVVFKARQRSLDRIVCVKMMLMAELAEVDEFKRFRAEAMAIARLRHPGIVAIYEAGQYKGTPYYTMEFVAGAPLSKFVSETPIPAMTAAQYVEQIATAVHVAHEHGIIHRDLKPSNVLVDDKGGTHITDFGVAKRLESDEDLTVTGQLLGTPSFMSPEQAIARRGEVGKAADIYALGAILYALLTGRPPHRGAGALETVRQVTTETPVYPRVLNSRIPADLETICMKCLEKSPSARYATAADVASDARCFLAGQPIRARRVGIVARATRSARRHPTATIAVASFILLGLAAALGLTLHNHQLTEMNRRLGQSIKDHGKALARAQRNELRARNLQYVSDMQLVEPYAAEGDYHSSEALLRGNVPPPGKLDLRGFEWQVLQQRQGRTGHKIDEISSPLYFICVSPDGKTLATGGADCIARLYRRQGVGVAPALELPTEQGEINGLCFSSDGLRLATAGDDGRICVWDIATRRQLLSFAAHPKAAFNVAFVRDDTLLLTCGADAALQLWDAATGVRVGTLAGHDGPIDAFALSGDRQRVWSVAADLCCVQNDLESLGIVGTRIEHSERPTCVAVTPDGRLSVSGELDARLIACNTASGKTQPIRVAHPVQSVAISPDGRRLAVGDRNGALRIWRIRVSEEAACGYVFEAETGWYAHEGRIYGIAFASDGKELISVGTDGATRAWDIERLISRGWSFPWNANVAHEANSFEFLTQSTTLVSANPKVGIDMWDCSTPSAQPVATIPFPNACCLGGSPDGSLLAAGTADGIVALWRWRDEELLYEWDVECDVFQVAISPRNDYVAVVTWQPDSAFRQTQIFRTRDGAPLFATPRRGWRHVAFAPRQPILYVALDEADHLIEWDLRKQTSQRFFNAHDTTICNVAISPDGTYVVSVSDDRIVLVHNTKDHTDSQISTGLSGDVLALLMGPRGNSVAIADSLGVVRVCNLRAAKRVVDLVRIFKPGSPSGFALSPAGRYLVVRWGNEFHLHDLMPLGTPAEQMKSAAPGR